MLSSLLQVFRGLFADMQGALLPDSCIACGSHLSPGVSYLCPSCLSQLPYTFFRARCDNPAERLFHGVVQVERVDSYLFYTPASSSHSVLMALKYEHMPDVGRVFGRKMASELKDTGFFDTIDGIVPIPLAPKRLRSRGYNQSLMLAEGIAKEAGLPVWDKVVERTVETQSQTLLSHAQRRKNVEGVFACTCPQQITGRHLLIVDDVVTTGATLSSCISSMEGFSGTRFSILTLAMTVFQNSSTLCKPVTFDL